MAPGLTLEATAAGPIYGPGDDRDALVGVVIVHGSEGPMAGWAHRFAALLAARTGEALPADWASAPPEQLQGWCGQLGGGTVVITMGRRGGFFSVPADNYWQLPETYGRFEAFSVSAIDTTGAGDAFNGNLAAALAGGEALQPALTRAAAAAALSTTALGAAPSMPDAAAVDQLLTTFPVTN